jgi:hypothetical protein
MKPKGLWVSVDGPDDWLSWCRQEHFAESTFKYRHVVTLFPEAHVLLLEDEDALDRFSKEFVQGDGRLSSFSLDWVAVTKRWQGILIPRYLWSRRHDDACSWYYGWDCASGCIWDAAAIQSVTRDKDWTAPVFERWTWEDEEG